MVNRDEAGLQGHRLGKSTHLCSEEDVEVLTVRQDRMLRDLVEEAVKGFSSGLDEVIVESLHHTLHDKLLWQRLRTKNKSHESHVQKPKRDSARGQEPPHTGPDLHSTNIHQDRAPVLADATEAEGRSRSRGTKLKQRGETKAEG